MYHTDMWFQASNSQQESKYQISQMVKLFIINVLFHVSYFLCLVRKLLLALRLFFLEQEKLEFLVNNQAKVVQGQVILSTTARSNPSLYGAQMSFTYCLDRLHTKCYLIG